MPTYDSLPGFKREFAKLTLAQRAAFLSTVAQFREDLERGKFRKGLRVKRVQGHEEVWELTWANDGRATFHYGDEVVAGQPHIVWRRIGAHTIFNRP